MSVFTNKHKIDYVNLSWICGLLAVVLAPWLVLCLYARAFFTSRI